MQNQTAGLNISACAVNSPVETKREEEEEGVFFSPGVSVASCTFPSPGRRISPLKAALSLLHLYLLKGGEASLKQLESLNGALLSPGTCGQLGVLPRVLS